MLLLLLVLPHAVVVVLITLEVHVTRCTAGSRRMVQITSQRSDKQSSVAITCDIWKCFEKQIIVH